MEAIEIKGLSKDFKTRRAVDDLNLTVHDGEFLALLGQNGAGKTTTIKMLSCLSIPTAGDALIYGDSILTAQTAVKQKCNVSPQETAVAPKLNVRENLELIARIYGYSKSDASAKSTQLLTEFSLLDRQKDRAKSLSGGMQRRLSIAMALISEPRVLYLDEPTVGLDVRARRELWHCIRALKGKITIVLTTHYMEEAEALCDRIAVLHEGKLQALGTLEELKEQTGRDTLEDIFLFLTDGEVEL